MIKVPSKWSQYRNTSDCDYDINRRQSKISTKLGSVYEWNIYSPQSTINTKLCNAYTWAIYANWSYANPRRINTDKFKYFLILISPT